MKKLLLILLLLPVFLNGQVTIIRKALPTTVFGSPIPFGSFILIESTNLVYSVKKLSGLKGDSALSNYILNSDYQLLNKTAFMYGEHGTAQGQMAFWDATAAKWVHTETSEMFWDDVNKRFGIGTTAPVAKLTLKDGYITLQDAEVTHGMTSTYYENSYGLLSKLSSTAGGMQLIGISDTDYGGIRVQGVIGTATPSTTTSSVSFRANKKNGTTVQALGTADLAFQFLNDVSPLVSILGNGNVGIGTTSPRQKLQVVGASQAPVGTGIDGIFRLTTGTGLLTDNSLEFGIVDGSYSWIQAVHPETDVRKLVLNPLGGNVGIGTTAPTNILSFGGNAARTWWIERHTTANTAGNTLTIQAGGATAAATDKAGGNLILAPGLSTGTGNNQILFKTSTPGSKGTSDNALATRVTLDYSALALGVQLTSSLVTGTSPFAVTSTTVNTNLNADLLDGHHWSDAVGLVTIPTTQVAYGNATSDGLTSDANLTRTSGLLTLTDGSLLLTGATGTTPTSGKGTRLMWIPEKGAFRAGKVDDMEWDTDSIGNYSFANGEYTKAIATHSLSTGLSTRAGGIASIATGYTTTADSYAELVIGRYNIGGGTSGSWVNTDPIFEIGIGTSPVAKANALTVFKNGQAHFYKSIHVDSSYYDSSGDPGTSGQILSSTVTGTDWTAAGAGTVTNVAALTLGTTGTDLSSTVANSTTTPVITLQVPTASASNRGALSSSDWSTFNGKQAALNGTGFVKASGTTISYDNTTYEPDLGHPAGDNYILRSSALGVRSWFDASSSLHNPVTLGTANGLSLSTQVLSLALASTSTTGALSDTDWDTFNNKMNADASLTFSGDVYALWQANEGGIATIQANAVEGSMLNNNVISGQTALTTGVTTTDELLVSDAGTIKRMDIGVLSELFDAEIKTVKVSLSAAQVNTLGTPFTLIAAPGAGKVIDAISIIYRQVITNTLEVGTQNLLFNIGSQRTDIINSLIESSSTIINITNSTLITGAVGADENSAFTMKLSSSTNPSSGSATMDIYITYRIITL